jgi:quinolinate synthase
MYQAPLPEPYATLTSESAVGMIQQRKEQLAGRMVILGHHYQRDEIIQFADFTGDSLKLSQIAAQQADAEFIVFCGVHFMAESADILTSDEQKVLLPDMTAGCPMADMAEIDQVQQCWNTLQQKLPHPEKAIPITYVNSSAAIKAFCGAHGGLCCTSGNGREVLETLWQENPESILLFLPDQHLGRNTGYALERTLQAMPLWDPYQEQGGIPLEQLQQASMILWDGYCTVHMEFTPEQIQQVRAEEPDANVIVHPECKFDVVQQSDFVGSTETIIRIIQAAEPGTSWVVGTEINLVNRLAQQMADRNIKVRSLSRTACLCETMYRIDLPHLAWLLNTLWQHCQNPDRVPLANVVSVDEPIRTDARIALDKMLEITASPTK